MRFPAVHIRAAVLLVSLPTAFAFAQSPPSPASPRDTVVRDTVPRHPATNPDTTAISDTTQFVAPRLKSVVVTGNNTRTSSYLRLESSSATRTPTLLRDVAQAVTVINRALIKDQAMQNMADVARYVPGVTMGQGEGNRDQPTIRGNSTTADFYVDGVRDDAQYFRDLYNVERVEALKGSNAMIFGRGGGGGVMNRVVKEAGWSPAGELTLQGGSYENRRASLDVGRGLSSNVAARFNGVYENSDTFRDNVWTKRQGMNPTVSIASPSKQTRINLGYENFIDYRTADRGIPSFGTAPVATDISTFFGNPEVNFSRTRVNGGSASLSHATSAGVNVHNQTRFTSYDKTYQNVLPGAVDASGINVSMSAYNNAHQRTNIFNQTDVTYTARSWSLAHTLLIGGEIGRQGTDNFRNTGYFNDTATAILVPVATPIVSTPVSFRQSATDADNRVVNTTRSIYAQDQVELNDHVQLIAGLRYENFGIRYHDNRSNSTLTRDDKMISPRVGVVLKPAEPASLYASYSVSYLPSAGDQFSSLTNVTAALEPEKFENIEAGAKWDVADRVALSAALYRLDRSNTRAPSAIDPSVTIQTGSQRSQGWELGVAGQVTSDWNVAGGFTRQRAVISSTTAAAKAGTAVPLVPATTLSLWNKYRVLPQLSLGLGVVHQANMYAAISNTVRLPAFTRVDGGLYFSLTDLVSTQLNLENVFNRKYYPLATGNNNITPGAPRSFRVLVSTHL
ncbi:MAG TPA: TonB-dependent siderophore receptor [Gemmatimonadaceae bacterium]|nr:TonB-dependent siderophore receptor [Gemmatimonadaceae bacterium]